MRIIGVRDNENNRWKKNAKEKRKKEKKRKRGTGAIAKRWEINDSVERLRQRTENYMSQSMLWWSVDV